MSLQCLRVAVLFSAVGLGGVQAQVLPEDPLQPAAPLMSMQFQNIDLRAAFQVIANFSGLNIVTSDNVTGTALCTSRTCLGSKCWKPCCKPKAWPSGGKAT